MGNVTGKKPELPTHLQPPNAAVIIISLIVGYTSICGGMSFSLGPGALFQSFLLILFLTWMASFPLARLYPSSLPLFVTGFITCLVAYVNGISNYHTNYSWYIAAKQGRTYNDVSIITAKASAYKDAGEIFFSDGYLDETRSIGWKGPDYTFCVAPIVPDIGNSNSTNVDLEAAQKVQFWAIGLDCCSARGDFSCDGAGEIDAKGGLVYHSPEEGITSDFLAPKSYHTKFMLAVQAAVALHGGIEMADDPVLIHWVADPSDVVEHHRTQALLFWGINCLIASIIITGVWLFIHFTYDAKIRTVLGAQAAGGGGFQKAQSQYQVDAEMGPPAGGRASMTSGAGRQSRKDPFLTEQSSQ